MGEGKLQESHVSPAKLRGASPSEDQYYFLVLYDISEAKKARLLVKILNHYGVRVQKSVFEGHVRQSQAKDMLKEIRRLMASERFFDPDDNVRIYRIAGECELCVFGEYESQDLEENIFF